MITALLLWIVLGGAQAAPDEPSLRAAVQRFYDAQAAKDLPATSGTWSHTATGRLTDDTYKAIFDTGEDVFTIEIRELAIAGSGARLKVQVKRVRTTHEQGRDQVYRGQTVQNQEWRVEEGAWKLVSDRDAAEDFADRLFSLSPDQRSDLLEREPNEVTKELRHAIAMRASAEAARQKFTDALSAAELTLAVDRALHDRNGEIEDLQNIANAYYFLRDYARAEENFSAALSAARAADAPEQVALACLGLGTVAYSRGEYPSALVSYEAAKMIYEERGEGASMGRAIVSIGNVQFLMGEYDLATASYRRAQELLLDGQDFGGAWLARSGLARVLVTQGDLTSGLREYDALLGDTRARPTPGQTAAALESLGEVEYRIGDTDAARKAFERAHMFYDALLADLASAARVLGDLGLTELSAGRRDAALAAYTASRDAYQKAKRPDGVAHAWVGIGFSLASARKFDEAIAAYKTAITMLDAQQRDGDSARAWLGLAMAQGGSGAYHVALETARHVHAAADKLNHDELRWRAGVQEGAMLRRLGRLDDAMAALQTATAVIEHMSLDVATSADTRTALADSASAWTELAFTLAQKQDARGALLAAEQHHAQGRRLMFAPFERDITTGMTDAERRDEEDLRRDIVSTRAQVRAERASPHADPARLSRLQEQLADVTKRRAERQAALYARLPDLAAWRGIALPADLSSAPVPDGALLVEYLVGEDELLVTWSRNTADGPVAGATVVPAASRDIAEAVAKALEPAALENATEWRSRSASVADMLLGPVKSLLTTTTECVVVPDDFVWRVPFEALSLGASDLGSHATVTYSSSLVALARHPSLWTATSVNLGLVAPTLFAAIPDDERAARRTMASSVLTVIAAPVDVNGAAPMFSSVLLRPGGEGSSDDGRLEVRELFDVQSAHGLLILPDGHAFDRTGIEPAMVALDWAAAAAGIPALVIGRGSAFATAAQARAFIDHLVDGGESVSGAWRAAMADVRATGARAPAAWAGLRLLGSTR